MNIHVEGIQPVLPLWLIVVVALLSIALAFWSYLGMDKIPRSSQIVLALLRSLALFILTILLLNPFFEQISIRLIKPEIIYMFDNSASTGIKKGTWQGKETYRQVIDDLQVRDTSSVIKLLYALNGEAHIIRNPDSLTLNGNNTNLFNGLEAINKKGRDIRAAVLVTDGIFTQGRDPSFLASQIDVPVFTIGLGDTTEVKDIIIKNVITNYTGYTNTLHKVEVQLINQGFKNKTLDVFLRSGGEVIDRKHVTTQAEHSSHSVTFTIELKEPGLKQYQISVNELDEEWTSENNLSNFAIDILDNKTRVSHVSFEIHPDVKAIRQIIRKDESYVVESVDIVARGKYLKKSLEQVSPDSMDLLILHGFNASLLNRQSERALAQLMESVPTLFIRSPATRYNNAPDILKRNLPLQSRSFINTVPVSLVQAAKKQEHPILELPEINYMNAPLVNGPINQINVNTPALPLFYAYYQNNTTDTPLIAVREAGNIRSAILNFHGFYKWQQSSNSEVRSYFTELLFNITDWTSTRPDNQRLKIIPAQKVFEAGNTVILNAFLNNESGEKESDGVIDIAITKQEGVSRFYTMENMGDGRYSLSLNNLTKGLYSFKATAKKGNRTIDTKNGEFSVSSTNKELVDTKRNEPLLRQIAHATGAAYLSYSKADSLIHKLNNRDLLSIEEEEVRTSRFPYQSIYWFLLLVIFLTAEWLYRKYLALP